MQESVMQRMWNSGYLSGGNAAYVEELYELYLHDPNAVQRNGAPTFRSCRLTGTRQRVSHSTIAIIRAVAKNQRAPTGVLRPWQRHERSRRSAGLSSYRMRGHQAAQLDRLGVAAQRAS